MHAVRGNVSRLQIANAWLQREYILAQAGSQHNKLPDGFCCQPLHANLQLFLCQVLKSFAYDCTMTFTILDISDIIDVEPSIL